LVRIPQLKPDPVRPKPSKTVFVDLFDPRLTRPDSNRLMGLQFGGFGQVGSFWTGLGPTSHLQELDTELIAG